MQNDVFYLKEAFKQLSALNEDSFNLADVGVVDELQSFVADDIEAPYEEEVIDVDADNAHELQDSYIGKVVLQCKCCNAKIYKDKEDVVVDEESESANVDEECPVCKNAFGWNIIGKIEPFDDEDEDHDDHDEDEDRDEEESEVEISDEEVVEALKESKALKESLQKNESVSNQDDLNLDVYDALSDVAYEYEVDKEEDLTKKDMQKATNNFNDKFFTESINEANEFVYSFGTDLSDKDLLQRDVDALNNFGLKLVGVSDNGDFTGEVFIKGPKNAISKYLDQYVGGIQINNDYLVKANDFDSTNSADYLNSHRFDIEESCKDIKEDKLQESLARWADTDIQEEVIRNIEDRAKEMGIGLHIGTKVGKYPQTVILDHRHQDGVIRVSSNGAFEINGEEFGSWKEDYESFDEISFFGDVSVEDALRSIIEDDEKDESLNEGFIDKLKSLVTSASFIRRVMSREGKVRGTKILERLNNLLDQGDKDRAFKIMKNYIAKDKLLKTLGSKPNKIQAALNDILPGADKYADEFIDKLASYKVDESLNESKKTYRCDDCGYEVELSDDEYDGKCPNCGEHHGFYEVDESLNESIENLSLDTDTTHMEMTSEDNGKVTIVTEPRNTEEVAKVEDEMIAPLSDEEANEIEGNVAEEPTEDEFAVDEFDEETFNELGESFLRKVYENVNSFTTTSIKGSNKKLVVEGLIKFNSGKERKTTFKFENFKTTKRGKTILNGFNEMFSKNKKSFTLKGTLTNKHFVSESLTYQYNVKNVNESNNSEILNIHGKAVVKK